MTFKDYKKMLSELPPEWDELDVRVFDMVDQKYHDPKKPWLRMFFLIKQIGAEPRWDAWPTKHG